MARLKEIVGKAISGEWGLDDEAGTGIPVLRTTNFTNEGIINFSDVVTRTINKKDLLQKYLRPGDIIIEKSGGSDKQPVGRVVYYDGAPDTYLFNNFTGVLRIINPAQWNSKYLFYALYANYLRGGTRKYQNKTTGLHNLKTDQYVEEFEVDEISLSEQYHVATILDKLRELISLRKQQLAKLDELVKARFVEMFGDPTSNPMGWNASTLKSVTSKIGSGATPKGGKESYQVEGITLIRSMNVHDGRFEYKDLAHINDSQAEQLSNVEVYKNDVFINITGASVARSCIVPDDVLPARVNQHVSIVRCKQSFFRPIFANQQFLNTSFKKLLLELGEAGGATRQAITKQQLEDLIVVVPPLNLQEEFSVFVAHVGQQKLTIQQSLDKLEVLRRSLMQEYFG